MTVYAGYGLEYLTDLKAIAPALRCNLMCVAVQEQKAFYQFNDTATDDADNSLIVAPNEGDGRWFALGTPSSGGEGGGGGSSNLFRDNTTSPSGITPDFPGQLFVGTSGGSVGVSVAIGETSSDWHSIYYFSNS